MKLLHPDLSYALRGIFFDVCNQYGLNLKEKIYQKVIEEALVTKKISYEREKRIEVYSQNNGKVVGVYIPDFVVDNKIIVEIKVEPFITSKIRNQIMSYLRISKYELAFMVNFGSEELEIKRLIFTNDRKPYLNVKNL